MALNSLIGVDLDNQTEVDSVVEPFTTTGWVSDLSSNTRPEEKMARNMISITESDKKIVNSKYRPQLNLRIEGSYKNPAYDFSREFKPNYAVMANFSMPVFEWGKMNKESRAAKSKVNIASQSLQKTIDRINLEVSTSRLSLMQAIEQVNLTDSSQFKAFENERLATVQY